MQVERITNFSVDIPTVLITVYLDVVNYEDEIVIHIRKYFRKT